MRARQRLLDLILILEGGDQVLDARQVLDGFPRVVLGRPAHPLHLVLGPPFRQPLSNDRLRLVRVLAGSRVEGSGRCALGRRALRLGRCRHRLRFTFAFFAVTALVAAPG